MAKQENQHQHRISAPAPHEHHHATPDPSSPGPIYERRTETRGRFNDENLRSFDDSPVVSDQPKAHLRNLAAGARDRTTRLASEVRDQTAKLASQAGQALSRLSTEQKNRAADGLHRLAGLLRDPARDLEQSNVRSQLANYTNRAAVRIDEMSTYMRAANFSMMLRDAGQLARRRPEVLLGGTILVGLLVVRFLKVSRRGAAEPWTSTAGRWHATLRTGTQVVSAAADTLKERAEARSLSPEAVVGKLSGSGFGKYLAAASNRHWRKS
jgi:hypothetical protein